MSVEAMSRNFPSDTPHAIALVKARQQRERLVKNLRDPAFVKRWFDQIGDQAADEIESLERELAEATRTNLQSIR